MIRGQVLSGGTLRNFEQDVEMVCHDTKCDNPHSAKGFVGTHEFHEMLLFEITECEISVHDPRDAVVEGHRSVLIHFQSWLPHTY